MSSNPCNYYMDYEGGDH